MPWSGNIPLIRCLPQLLPLLSYLLPALVHALLLQPLHTLHAFFCTVFLLISYTTWPESKDVVPSGLPSKLCTLV